jgi:hypothetical protein
MNIVIICEGYANGQQCPFIGQYLQWYDPGAPGVSVGGWTPDLAQAQKFPDMEAAFRCYNQVHPVQPLRPDGKPNKPLTAFTVEFKKEDSNG